VQIVEHQRHGARRQCEEKLGDASSCGTLLVRLQRHRLRIGQALAQDGTRRASAAPKPRFPRSASAVLRA
jgi:hypothetical protein